MPVKKQTTSRSSSTTKKAVAKKPVAKKAVKKAVPKKAVKKVEPKKVQKTTKKPVAKTTLKKALVKKEVKSGEEKEVVVPTNMSIRTREKALVLEHHWRKAMHAIAYTSGLCFALVGGTLALLSVFSTAQLYAQPAQSIDATTNQIASIPEPVLQVTSQFPDEITQDIKISFVINDVSLMRVNLQRVGAVSAYPDIEINNLLNDKYRVTINRASYPDGEYNLLIAYKPKNLLFGPKIKKMNTTPFFIGERPALVPEVTSLPEQEPEPGTESNNNSPDSGSSPDEVTLEPVSSIDVPADDIGAPIDIVTQPNLIVPPSDPVPSADQFRIFSTQKTLQGVVAIGVGAPDSYARLELYARPLNSLNPQFITIAAARLGQRQFAFDSANRLANGTYEFYAQSKNANGETVRTNSITLTVSNTNSTTPTLTTSPKPPVAVETDPIVTSENSAPVVLSPRQELIREFTEVDFKPTILVNDVVDKETTTILERNGGEIEKLLRNYAVAKQSGDEMLIDAAKNELQNKRESMVFDAMNDDRVKDLADNIDERITERIEQLEKRTDAFEALRKERSSGQSSVDTDGDGISDYDEENIYKTNPNEADSDNDGFTDGVEIIRGFNPVDAKPEAIIQFESPRESFALVRDDVLVIEEITPLISTNEGEPPVRAQIKGRGIPNSFVTLFIFSNPVVVTVKTDADGSFVYTLDKELEDGSHDVFVAVTDNTGSILGQSNAFSFIKEAEAFTPVDASEDSVVTADSVREVTSQNSYSAVAGVGILALGVILIMLGVSLRTKKDDDDDDTLRSGRIVEEDTDSPEEETIQTAHVSSKKFEHIDAT